MIALGIASYLVIWWLALFAVLPFGVRSQHEMENTIPGTEPGAPVRPQLWLKLLATTLVSTVIWLLGYVLFVYGLAAAWKTPA